MVGVAIVVIAVDVCAVFASAANDKSIDDEHDHDNTTAIDMMMVKTMMMMLMMVRMWGNGGNRAEA